MTFNGTRPYMAPEMFEDRPYTDAVDLWALGMVIAWLMYGNPPRGYKGYEGSEWCEDVVSHFKEYEKRSQKIAASEHEQIELNLLVGQYMLKMNPEQRESAKGCQKRGDPLWQMLDQVSDGSNANNQEDPKKSSPTKTGAKSPDPYSKDNGLMRKNEASKEKGALAEEREDDPEAETEFSDPPRDEKGDLEQESPLNEAESRQMGGQFGNDSEAKTEFFEGDPPNSDEWRDLEREFPAKSGRRPRHFVHGNPVKEFGHIPEHPTIPDS